MNLCIVTLEKEVLAWTDVRNQEAVKIKRSAVAVALRYSAGSAETQATLREDQS